MNTCADFAKNKCSLLQDVGYCLFSTSYWHKKIAALSSNVKNIWDVRIVRARMGQGGRGELG